MRNHGRITTWKDDKGFGFITPNDGGNEVFVHVSAFSNRQRRPTANDLVTYQLKVDGKGKAQATAVAFVGEMPRAFAPAGRSSVRSMLAVCFGIFLVGVVVAGRLPSAVLVVYLVASVVTFFAYAFDKSAAMKNQWRTRESTLHVFAVLGGWPGALVAQQLLRHKSAKASFQTTFWITVVCNCGMLGWLLSPQGAQAVETVLRAM